MGSYGSTVPVEGRSTLNASSHVARIGCVDVRGESGVSEGGASA
jgi:hypothetical protein